MALNTGIRSVSRIIASSEASVSRSASRSFHSTGAKKMSGGHGHDEPYYLHAKHMYNLDRMKYQGLKMSLGVFTAFKGLLNTAKPSTSTEIEDKDEDANHSAVPNHQRKQSRVSVPIHPTAFG